MCSGIYVVCHIWGKFWRFTRHICAPKLSVFHENPMQYCVLCMKPPKKIQQNKRNFVIYASKIVAILKIHFQGRRRRKNRCFEGFLGEILIVLPCMCFLKFLKISGIYVHIYADKSLYVPIPCVSTGKL